MKHMTRNPLVTCIMPTRDRRLFVSQAIKYFLRQDYVNRELIIVDDGADSVRDLVPDDTRIHYIDPGHWIPLGTKRNLACDNAQGELIVHWDDDDWMADWRLSYQVKQLLKEQADICGLRRIYYLDIETTKTWQYTYPQHVGKPWVAGGTLCYKKELWLNNRFLNINIGEDTQFVWSRRIKKVTPLLRTSFYVAIIHPKNTSPKSFTQGWSVQPTNVVQGIMGHDWLFYASLVRNVQKSDSRTDTTSVNVWTSRDAPLVSCVMPTYNRRHLISQAIQYFLRQDYPNRELIIVDDGSDVVKDLVPDDPRIRYIKLPIKQSLGTKRNHHCRIARGEVIVFWDDDDWYATNRISYQVLPILKGQADMTALGNSLFLSLPDRQFWSCTSDVFDRMFLYGVASGTLAFRKRIWDQETFFPDCSVAEDAAFIKKAVRKGARLQKLANPGVFFYLRHGSNSWTFEVGEYVDRAGWLKVEPPTFIPKQDLTFYGIH